MFEIGYYSFILTAIRNFQDIVHVSSTHLLKATDVLVVPCSHTVYKHSPKTLQ